MGGGKSNQLLSPYLSGRNTPERIIHSYKSNWVFKKDLKLSSLPFIQEADEQQQPGYFHEVLHVGIFVIE